MSQFGRRQTREQYLKDYVAGGLKLFWQRHAMYFGAFVLAISYYGTFIGIVCYLMILLTEVFDHAVARRIHAWNDNDPIKTDTFYYLVLLGTVLSASAISFFILTASWMEGTEAHFTPLLFLFAAALFAAMNTHQIVLALTIRLSIYGTVFLAIALQNILETRAPLGSVHWLHFFTVVFVMYFIVDCSLVFLRMYRRNLKQMEHLKREHARAVEAYHAKSEFLSVVSHELRTPITSIKGSLNIVCSGKLGDVPKGMTHMIGIANKNSDRLATLIDDLLDLQAMEAGKLGMSFKSIDLCSLVRESIDATANYLKDKQVSVRFEGVEHAIMVIADTKRLMQVMVNVLSNAIKFSESNGSIDVRIQRSGRNALISVRDFGKGIPPGHEEQVFAAFAQIDSSDRRSVNGSGLGMAVSKHIMHEHDGEISYESELGVGTVFKISLPLAKVPDEVKPNADHETASLLHTMTSGVRMNDVTA